MNRYFVMVHTATGSLLPLMSEAEKGAVAIFNNPDDAKACGEASLLGGEFGCSVFDCSESI